MISKSSVFNLKSLNRQRGYIALMSAIIISLILVGLSFTVSASGYFSRFNVLDSEFKRVSKGLAESCQNVALLKVAQNYSYDPTTDPSYSSALGGVPITVGSNTCLIKPYYHAVVLDAPNHKKTVYIATQASYHGAFSNIQVTATAQDPNQSVVTPTVLVATVIVPAGATIPQVKIDGGSPITSGQSVNLTPGIAHTVAVASAPTGPNSYTTAGWAGACNTAGTFTPTSGSSNSCYITYTIVPTTAKITLLASYSPTGGSSILKIDGLTTINGQTVAWGQPINLSAGTHSLTATTPNGYIASSWSGSAGCSGAAGSGSSGSLTAGSTYTCVVTFSQPNLACADTVMMFDRSGSMNSTDLANENAAAKALLSFYAQATSPAKVGAGSFGGLDGTSASVPVNGQLTSSYGTDSSNQSVGPSFPTAATTPNQWTAPNFALANDTSYATSATNGQQQGYNKFGFNIASGNSIKGIEVAVDAKVTGGTPTNTGNLSPNNTGNFNTWGVSGTINKTTAVSDASNNTYISQGTDGQSFVMANAGVPASASINSVTLYAVASGNNSSIQLMEENGTNAGQQVLDSGHNLSAAWTTYTWNIPTTPSGAAWSATEVNSWSTRFGVFKSSPGGTAQVSQMYVVVNYSSTADSSNLSPTATGNYDAWTVSSGTNNAANRLAAVANNGGTYDSSNTNGNAETVAVAGAGVPSGAVINFVTLYASVAESGGSSGVSLRVENGVSAGNRSDDSSHQVNSTSFNTISRVMSTNPLTGSSWTQAEVNAWTTRFGVVRTNNFGGTPKVDQIWVVVNYSTTGNSSNLFPSNTANFNSSTWTVTGSASKQAALADALNTSYISEGSIGQTFSVANANINSSYLVNSVTVYALSDESGGANELSLMVESGSNYSIDSGHTISNTSFNSPAISWTMPTNPLTGSAWTTAEVNAWTTRFGVFKSAPNGTAQVSQIYVVVNYSNPATGNLAVSLSWNNGGSWTSPQTVAVASTEAVYNLGGTTDTWGRTWAPADFGNSNFVVRVQNNSANGIVMSVDYLTVKVDYGDLGTGLYNAINLETGYNNPTNSSVGTNIQDAITKGNAELLSSRHVATNKKVLILVSDGEPSKPTGNLTTDSNNALAAANTAKSSGTTIFTVRYSTDTNAQAITLMQNLAYVPADAIIPATAPGSPPTASQMQTFFTQIANAVCPAAAAAVQANLNVMVQMVNTNGGTLGPSAVTVSTSNNASSVAPASQTTSADGTSITYVYPPFNSGNSVIVSGSTPTGYYSPLYVSCPTSATNIPLGQTMFCTLIYGDTPPPPTVVSMPPPPNNIGIGGWQENP